MNHQLDLSTQQPKAFTHFHNNHMKNLPYYIWTYTFNTTLLDIIDKCHNRNNSLKILSLPEIQPSLDPRKNYIEYFNNWSETPVDIICSGYGKGDKEEYYYENMCLFRHLSPKRHFFPLYFLYCTFSDYQLLHESPPAVYYNALCHFTTYNRAPRPHRLYVLQLLKDSGLLDINFYSCFSAENFNVHEFNAFTENHFDFKNLTVKENHIDLKHEINRGMYARIFPSFYHSAFQAVTETLPEPIFLTEKTFLPIINKKPFITYGAKNINKCLLDFGFKLYDDIFNYDFDDIDNNVIRAQEYVKELNRVCKEYHPMEIVHKLKDVAQFNYEVAMDILKNNKFIPDIFLEWEKEFRDEKVWNTHMALWFYKFRLNIKNY